MNLVLFEAAEVAAAGGAAAAAGADGEPFELELTDRRAVHLQTVVRVAVGGAVRVGVVEGAVGQAEVLAVGEGRVRLRARLAQPAPPQLPVHLLLAIPRPKVLLRTLAIAASFGVERIDLTNSWRVDKSYLTSPALSAESLGRALRDGAEQGATSRLPAIAVHRRLMALLDAYPGGERDPARRYLIAHPGAAQPLEAVASPGSQAPLTIAVGPEGGWIAREVETFAARGFAAVAMGTAILRVEAAIASLLGQVQLLRRMSGDRTKP